MTELRAESLEGSPLHGPEGVFEVGPAQQEPLVGLVAMAFGDHGPLARSDPGYRERQAQTQLACEIARAIEERRPLVAEAGTGVGKTFAYLVPALMSGQRVLVSTATKSLQDQLFLRDLPHVRRALQLPVQIALLKGRSSYLCLHRLEQARQAVPPTDRRVLRALAHIEQWAQGTDSGDLAELDALDERSPVIPLVTSTRENCLGSDCPKFRQCHVHKARREALAADVVVINHHLFFADVALRETGMAELLPSVEVLVFDEAHQLVEAGVQFLGSALGSGQMSDFARDMLAAGLQQARGLVPWDQLAAACERAGRELRLACAGPRESRGMIKLRWQERAGTPDLAAALKGVAAACQAAAQGLDTVSELSPDFPRLQARADMLAQRALRFAEPEPLGLVRWIDVGSQQARLVEAPLDIREAMREQIDAEPRAWVFTSATLGDDERLRWFTEPAGLDDAATLRVESPFNYAEHARLYVPKAFPKPSEAEHPLAVARLVARLAAVLGGRCFVLTTALRALQQIGATLRERFEMDGLVIDVLVQGDAPKRKLLERFVEHPASVLLGSQSFWEGIDVPGDALQCVVIDKLPFPPPNDPLVEARIRRLESEGRNAFTEYFVAEAAVALKQGAGRLIRTESDRGLLVVCDPRMATMGYGRRLLAALPPMTRLSQEAEALEWLALLAQERAGR